MANASEDLTMKLESFSSHFSDFAGSTVEYINQYKDYLSSLKYDADVIKEKMKDKVNEVFYE